jgi:hypothetical protein
VKGHMYNRLAGLKLARPIISMVAECRCRLFDWRRHINTCGTARLTELTILGDSTPQHGTIYHATHPKLVFKILNCLDITMGSISLFISARAKAARW